ERSWLYRIRPSVRHSGQFKRLDNRLLRTAPCLEHEMPPTQLRWSPTPIPSTPQSFIEGLETMTTAGDCGTQAGMAAHVYLATRSMQDEVFWNADGELLIVLQQERLRFVTEFGVIAAEPGEI